MYEWLKIIQRDKDHYFKMIIFRNINEEIQLQLLL